MVEPWVLLAIVVGLVVVAVSFTGLYIWRGIWLAENKGHKYARKRWTLYAKTKRKMQVRRIQKLRARGLAPPSVTLNVDKSAHSQRAKYARQVLKERSRNG